MSGQVSLSSLQRMPPGSIYEYKLDSFGRIDEFVQQGGGRILTIPRWKTMHVTEGVGIEGEGALTTVGEDGLLTLNHRRTLHHAIETNLLQLPNYYADESDFNPKKGEGPSAAPSCTACTLLGSTVRTVGLRSLAFSRIDDRAALGPSPFLGLKSLSSA